MFQPNQLRIIDYIPPKQLSQFGLPALVMLIIYSYINDNNPAAYLNTYYGICINTMFKPIDRGGELIRVFTDRINHTRYYITLDNIRSMINRTGKSSDIHNLINTYRTVETLRNILHRRFKDLKKRLTYYSLIADSCILFNITEYEKLLDECRNVADNYEFMNDKLDTFETLLKNKHNDIEEVLGLIDDINYYYHPYMSEDIRRSLSTLEREYNDNSDLIDSTLYEITEEV